MITLKQFLVEYKRDITVQRLGQKIAQRADRDRLLREIEDPADVLVKLEEVDPTPNKSFMDWIVKQFLAGIAYEDLASTVKANLHAYNQLIIRKRLPVEQRNINQHTATQLAVIIRDYEANFNGAANAGSPEERGEYKVVYNGQAISVVHLLDEKAAIAFGKNTSWCTTNGRYRYYAQQGDIYVVIPKYPSHRYEKYQLHYASKQCKDENDDSFKFSRLVELYPELRVAFGKIPEYQDLGILSVDEADLKRRAEARAQREKARGDEIESILKSMWS